MGFRLAAGAAFLPALLAFAGRAAAQPSTTEDSCLVDHKRTQELQLDKKLIEAEAAAIACARPQCPEEVRVMCTDFVTRIRASQPTVVFELKSASGEILAEGKVSIDGAKPRALDGSALTLDPGSHGVDFTAPGRAAGRAKILVYQGEKNKKVVLTFAGEDRGPSFSPWAYVLGGIGVASLAAFAGIGIATTVQADALEEDCGKRCVDQRPDDVDAVVRQAAAADVCLAAGLTFVAAAAITIGVTWSPAPASRSAVRVGPGHVGLFIAF